MEEWGNRTIVGDWGKIGSRGFDVKLRGALECGLGVINGLYSVELNLVKLARILSASFESIVFIFWKVVRGKLVGVPAGSDVVVDLEQLSIGVSVV